MRELERFGIFLAWQVNCLRGSHGGGGNPPGWRGQLGGVGRRVMEEYAPQTACSHEALVIIILLDIYLETNIEFSYFKEVAVVRK